MTLVLTIQTRGSIWLVADRRLSAPGRPPFDGAIKATLLEVADGVAVIGYAGLGATALGNQPSQWVSNVLRGRHHPLEQMLEVVATAMKREFLPHMNGVQDMRLRQHRFIIPALLNNRPALYSIYLNHTDGEYRFRYTRHILGGSLTPLQVTVPIAVGGSGAAALVSTERWKRPLLRLVKAYNRNKISGNTVAEHLAKIAYSSHLNTLDETVGPDCLVVWRNSKGGLKNGGGAHNFFCEASAPRAHTSPQYLTGWTHPRWPRSSRKKRYPA